jgi:CxxC motif-containing protein (DUF1111 family)
MRSLTIAAAALILGAVVHVANAQDNGNRAPFWPKLRGSHVVKEWYMDAPWNQKLGTFAGNRIDEALVLPYEALGDNEKDFCKEKKITQDNCMLELGINNILGMLRTDTPYDPKDPKISAAKECKDPALPCIEVRLELSSFWTRSTNSGVALLPRPFGTEPQRPSPSNPPFNAYYGGYVITDGSTYAPQMPWYMAHYCDSRFPPSVSDVQDPVCYGDYFSPMNNGFNLLPDANLADWPKSQPWSVYPSAAPGPTNHCKSGETKCTLAMAGFDFRDAVPSDPTKLQYMQYNNANLLAWFNGALKAFATDFTAEDLQRHFPWNGTPIDWQTFLYPQGLLNPFLGQFDDTQTGKPVSAGCDVTVTGPTFTPGCTNTGERRASRYLYPRQCQLGDLAGTNVAKLRQCSLNYELHHNGYLEQWPQSFWPDLNASGMLVNQYGRTSFLFAGVPGMQLPVPFYKDPSSDSGLSVYEQVYNASIFSLYLPIANEADVKHAFPGRNYTDTDFYHTLLMSNHMESDPSEFANGIRGRVLWHNEYRTQKMYQAFASGTSKSFPTKRFAASFDPQTAKAPFHNNTCDGCHVRNGSGVPINTAGTLDAKLQEFMTDKAYNPYPVKDYTFTGEIRPMKLLFFDLKPVHPNRVHPDPETEPLTRHRHYNNTIMNFYGSSFHLTMPGYNYVWNYDTAKANRLVVNVARVNAELKKTYEPWQVNLGTFQTSSSCQLVPPPPDKKPWPTTCADINNAAIHGAIADGAVGFMLLNGKRLANASAIEAIPNHAILSYHEHQRDTLGETMAGEIAWSAGSRDGVNGKGVHKVCPLDAHARRRPDQTKNLTHCYIGRFGWLGDRASLEDMVASAALVNMNMTTREGYDQLYRNRGDVRFPIRYRYPNCGPANETCVNSGGNGDLSEKDVERLAAYARWIGNPTRSEFQVALPEVSEGERIFGQAKCDTCHVIGKIDIDPDDTMLPKFFRHRLKTHVEQGVRPFLSYLGTDLLMHDMGYLSQVGEAGKSIRDDDGVVLPDFAGYVQKIRTPALKGLRFNRFVTDAHRNTKNVGAPACDFLLHDGRACDAIEAAFLHDGPAIKKLGVIEALNALTPSELRELRAFLYSL